MVDALDSGSSGSNAIGVQVPGSAFLWIGRYLPHYLNVEYLNAEQALKESCLAAELL